MEPTTVTPSDNSDNSIQPQQPDTPSVEPVQPPVKLPGKNKKPLMILIILVLLAAAGAAAFFLLNKDKDNSNDAPAIVKKEIPILTIGTEGPFTDLYPEGEVTVGGGEVIPQVYEGLVAYEAETKIVPSLALSWTNPDDLTWVFKLRPNVKFHSGRTMTAKDVKYGIEASKGFPFGDYFGTTISSVTVVDDLTVQIKTSEPDPILLNKLVFLRVLDSEIKEMTPLAGTGPYTLKPNTEVTASKLELVAFDDYHGGRPLTRELVFIEKSDPDSSIDALKKAELDVGYGRKRSVADELKSAGFSHINFDSLTVSAFSLNSVKSDSPFKKKEVRQAVSLAVDRAKIIAARAIDAEPRFQIQSARIPGFNSDLKDVTRDITKAKELLATAGYANGLTIEVSYFDAAGPKIVVEELTKQLADAGITVTADPQSGDTYFDDLYTGKFDMAYLSMSSDLLDGIDVFSNLFIDQPIYDDSLIIELYNKSNTTLDAKQRLGYLRDISKILYDDYAVLPVFEAQQQVIFKDTVHVSRDIPGANSGIYWWQAYQ